MIAKDILKYALAAVFAATVLSCERENPDSLQGREEFVPFTLTATYGDPDSKVAFDSDGLGMTWQVGDVLTLVDLSGTNSNVTMTANLTEPAKTASFTSKTSVLSGDYIVLYGATSQTITVKQGAMTDDLSTLAGYTILYGKLSVSDGQTSASISLEHALSKLNFTFKNVPSSLTNVNCGMAASIKGMSASSDKLNTSGWEHKSYRQKISFGWNGGTASSFMIIPYDYSGGAVFFYIYGDDANGNHYTYEFKKSGKNLKAGVSYNITLDCNAATAYTVLPAVNNVYSLSSPAQFRAASYWESSKSYALASDVDFDGEVCFPIAATAFEGNSHTLKNVVIDLENCDYVGILSSGKVQNLSVNGLDVTGKSYVGGIVAESSGVSKCSLTGTTTVSGSGTYVGGIVGYSSSTVSDVLVKGTANVFGNAYVGGITGYAYDSITQCGYEGNVTGTGSNVGGIAGRKYYCTINKCYVKGNVSGSNYVGGLLGWPYNNYSSYPCKNSYIIGDVTGSSTSSTSNIGGIAGFCTYCWNCYSYGTVSSGYGVAYTNNYASKNLTSSTTMGYSGTNSDYCNCGPSKTFLSLLSVINGDEAYSTQVWPDIDAKCPLLQWQSDLLNGSISIPGFGSEDW